MRRIEMIKSQLRKTGLSERILLFFLAGFFLGSIFYYMFQNSFSGLTLRTESGERSFWSLYLSSVWNHGKYFLLLWILSAGRVRRVYQALFVLYTGIRSGFLLMFFVFLRGWLGFWIFLISYYPHCLLLLPLYLFAFTWMEKRHSSKHPVLVYVGMTVVLLLACLLEVRYNYGLMGKW